VAYPGSYGSFSAENDSEIADAFVAFG